MPIIPATQDIEIERIKVQDQPRQRVSDTPSQPIAGHTAYSCHTSYVESINSRSVVQESPGKNMGSYPQNNQSKKGPRV
jgi:hypothetical protein